MRLYVQWVKAVAEDWQPIDLSSNPRAWRDLPKKAKPVSTSLLDLAAGWVSALNFQGVVFEGYDCYAVVPITNGLRVTVWNETTNPLEQEAQVWDVLTLAPDSRFGGALNTRQSRTIYASAEARANWPESVELTTFRPWAEFTPPQAVVTRYGKSAPDLLWEQHRTVREHHSWREWAI